jgi:RNA polymerase sigma-70 factor (ECF subfamily)
LDKLDKLDKEGSDLKLVERFQKGDIKAFDVLVSKYQKRVYEIAYSFAHNVDDAYDLSQDVFVRVFKSLRSFKKEADFYTWLYRISQNACIDYVRKRNRSQILELDDELINSEPKMFISSKSLSPNKKVELEELEREIKKAITQLPVKQKQAFILRHYEGKTLKEISGIMECQLGTVKAHLFHATRRLRQLLAPYVGDEL